MYGQTKPAWVSTQILLSNKVQRETPLDCLACASVRPVPSIPTSGRPRAPVCRDSLPADRRPPQPNPAEMQRFVGKLRDAHAHFEDLRIRIRDFARSSPTKQICSSAAKQHVDALLERLARLALRGGRRRVGSGQVVSRARGPRAGPRGGVRGRGRVGLARRGHAPWRVAARRAYRRAARTRRPERLPEGARTATSPRPSSAADRSASRSCCATRTWASPATCCSSSTSSKRCSAIAASPGRGIRPASSWSCSSTRRASARCRSSSS